MSVTSLVEQLTSDLNDDELGHENQTWTEDQIRAWVEEGASLVFDKRPDLFMREVVHKVTPCSPYQNVGDSCRYIRRVIGQSTADGRLLAPLRTRSITSTYEWTGKSCLPSRPALPGKFRLDAYAIDTLSNKLYLWPQVPDGEDVYVLLECAAVPDADEVDSGEATFPPGVVPAIKQWALWRAKSMDMEISQAAMAAAKLHYTAFFDALGLASETSQVVHTRSS